MEAKKSEIKFLAFSTHTPKVLGEISLFFSSLRWLDHSSLYLCLHIIFSSPSSSLIRTLSLGLGLTQVIQDDLKILNRIMSAKTLFPYKDTFTGSRGWGVDMSFGDHHSTLQRAQQYEVPEVSTLNYQSSSFLCHYLTCSVMFALLSLVWEMFSASRACVC